MDREQLAQAFKALGDRHRLKILNLIAADENICACDILKEFDFSQPTLSHHIKILLSANLIQCRKEGKWVHYTLDEATIRDLQKVLDDLQF